MLQIPRIKINLAKFLEQLPENPGVYKFIDSKGHPAYIGKAKNIKKRVKSYFSKNAGKSKKINNLIVCSVYLELTLTTSELEALLLEQRLIKEFKPKFNVQFKDDKGYPWIKIDSSKDFPSAQQYLGKKQKGDSYYGPFPNSYAVKDTLDLIQKTFKLRNCSDAFFKNRTRPCIQYQIGKCSAPCVNLINKNDYLEEVKSAEMLLQGKSNSLVKEFYNVMDQLAKSKTYEKAAIYRDKISSLRDIQRSQSITGFSKERDAVVINSIGRITKVGITHVLDGWISGHENFTQKRDGITESVLESFLISHYLNSTYCPSVIILSQKIANKSFIQEVLSEFHNKKVRIITKPGKKDKGLLEIAISNTNVSIERASKQKSIAFILSSLQDEIRIDKRIRLIESYDISHHAGKNAVGGCVVYGINGKITNQYRLYNISDSNSGNDISSMQEVIRRRYKKKNEPSEVPDLILIDGGLTHLKAVNKVLKDLGVNGVNLISISKGARRKSELDSIHKIDGSVVRITKGSLTHLLIQEIRDETHRFSITNQKKKQIKFSLSSEIDSMHGIGESTKKNLIRYFGSVDQIRKASYQDLQNVPGVGKKISNIIYQNLH
jgi:excinuclease ABC subunit C